MILDLEERNSVQDESEPPTSLGTCGSESKLEHNRIYVRNRWDL